MVLTAGLLLLAAACAPADQSPVAPSGPPAASATLHWTTLTLPRGPHCWNSAGHTACVDGTPPDVLFRSGYLKPYRAAGGYRVQITFHSRSAPINSRIELVMAPDGGRGAVKEAAPLAFDLPAVPSHGSGVYVYLVTGSWKEGSASYYLVLDEMPGVA